MFWEMFKDIGCSVYMDVVQEDLNNQETTYMLINENVSDRSFINGDGYSKLRSKTFNLRLFSSNNDEIYNNLIKEINKRLQNNCISYTCTSLFDPSTKEYIMTWIGDVVYGI